MSDFFDEIAKVQREGITLKRPSIKRILKRNPLFDVKDSNTWRVTCDECGCKNMEYYAPTFTYHCPKCGYVLEV